jgi:two-component system, chemotaxis family, protein-glutamate methylesterase/glutaminase
MQPGLPIRVLAIDDSAVVRGLLRNALSSCPQVELVGTAQDGAEGLEAIDRLKPDLVLLDVEMPLMNGLEVLAEIRAQRLHTRVIICSSATRRGAGITLEALAHGATDYVSKPVASNPSQAAEELNRQLLPKIFALFPPEGWHCPVEFPSRQQRASATPIPRVLVVGVSTGGPAALEKLLPGLPADFPLPILIAQHMPRLFTGLLAERLNALCDLRVCEAEPSAELQCGVVYLARGDWHLEIAGTPRCPSVRIHRGQSLEHCRPSVDLLFRSAASVYGTGALAVVLTGMGTDGLDGCRVVRAAGGRVLVQDKQTSAVWGMPGAVARAGLADQVLPLDAIAGELTRLVQGDPKSELAWLQG